MTRRPSRLPLRSFFQLTLLSFRLRPRSLAALSGAVAFGVLALALALAVGLGPARALKKHMRNIFPEQRMVLKSATADFLMLQTETTTLTPETLEAVRALEGVRRVSPEITVRFPLRAEGSLFGKFTYSTDLTVTAVEPWVLGDDMPPNFTWDPKKREVIPAVFSQYFLDLYNMALAESNGLPKLSRQAVIGRDFWIVLGESSIRPAGNEENLRYEECELVGLSDNPDLLGLVIPIEAVEAFNEWYGLKDKRYRALHVELASPDPEAARKVEAQAEGLGLRSPDQKAPWRKAVLISQIAGGVIVGLGALVLALSGAYVILATRVMLSAWRREAAIWRATGASLRLVRGVLVAALMLSGCIGVALGLGTGYGLVMWGARAYGEFAEQWNFLPPEAIQLPAVWAFGIALLVLGGMVLMAVWRVRRMLRVAIAMVLWEDR